MKKKHRLSGCSGCFLVVLILFTFDFLFGEEHKFPDKFSEYAGGVFVMFVIFAGIKGFIHDVKVETEKYSNVNLLRDRSYYKAERIVQIMEQPVSTGSTTVRFNKMALNMLINLHFEKNLDIDKLEAVKAVKKAQENLGPHATTGDIVNEAFKVYGKV